MRSVPALAALALVMGAAEAAASTARPKHIIFFMIDDYGFTDASYKNAMYNGTAAPPTPTIDALAMGGVRLESYYVNKLCSPTRTAMLSGRYAYTNGMDDGVIIDGQNVDMPLNLLSIADHFQAGGWNTSAYGKWDAGMTVWGSTPTCRGFDHYRGFYSAASDYFKHTVGAGYDYHYDQRGGSKRSDPSVSGTYTTEAVTSAVQEWIEAQVAARGKAQARTFAYVAHEAVHGPMEVPERYLNNECEALVPASHPTRRIYCGMVRAVDESVKNITATYEKLGILDDTLVVLSADNGGIPKDGGFNYPLRGNKATAFEGGVRALGFVSGAGLSDAVRGTVSRGLHHVTDWLPTLAGGAAGLDVKASGRACPTCDRPLVPLDGVNNWEHISAGAPSARTEVLLDLQATACNKHGQACVVPGSGALRVGKWKLMHGHAGVWGGADGAGGAWCTARTGVAGAGQPIPIPIPANASNPWCPFGWTPAPGSGLLPRPAPEVAAAGCTVGPAQADSCPMPADSHYLVGGTMLFDVEADMFEEHDVAAENPGVVAALLARLGEFNNTHCAGARCLPDNAGGAPGKPVKDPAAASAPMPVWLPWRGSSDPATCDTNRTSLVPTPPPTPPTPPRPPLPAGLHASTGAVQVVQGGGAGHPATVRGAGWCWDDTWAGGGVPPMLVRVSIDGAAVATLVANYTRAQLVDKTGAPNKEHGWDLKDLAEDATAGLAGPGAHKLDLDVFLDAKPNAASKTAALPSSPFCFSDGKAVSC